MHKHDPNQTNRKLEIVREVDSYVLNLQPDKKGRNQIENVKLSQLEAAKLLHQLLVLLPDIPWEASQALKRASRHRPVIVVYFKAENAKVVESHRQLESLFGDGARIVHGPVATDTPINTEVINDEVSSKVAQSIAYQQAAEAYARSQGITMKELFARAAEHAQKMAAESATEEV